MPTFDPIKMEQEMIDIKPGYLQPTTSQIMKELPLDEDEILLFKQREQELQRCKTSQNKIRTDLNIKADLAEFVINSRAQRLERFLEKEHHKQLDFPSKKQDIEGENNQLYNASNLAKTNKINYRPKPVISFNKL